MSIVHDGYTFPVNHQMPVPGDREYQDIREPFFGLSGEGEIRDAPHGRDITCEVDIDGGSTYAALDAVLQIIHGKINTLTGNLVIGGATFAGCTFKGLRINEPPFWDALQLQWIQPGVLFWRQLEN